MGYFSNLCQNEYNDLSYHGAEEQLLWRYEDLKQRYLELSDMDSPHAEDVHFTADDYRYAPIQYFRTPWDIHRAMEIARDDLETRYNIIVNEDGGTKQAEDDIPDPNQITMLEIIWVPLPFQASLAA